MALLEGSQLTDAEITAACEPALTAIDPPSDIRGSAEYRAHLVPHYLTKVLQDLPTTARSPTYKAELHHAQREMALRRRSKRLATEYTPYIIL